MDYWELGLTAKVAYYGRGASWNDTARAVIRESGLLQRLRERQTEMQCLINHIANLSRKWERELEENRAALIRVKKVADDLIASTVVVSPPKAAQQLAGAMILKALKGGGE